MPLIISNAILHSVSNTQNHSLFSNSELDIDSETCNEFVSKHVRRLLNNPGAKEATFTAESKILSMIQEYQRGELRFREMSRQVCERLEEVIRGNEDIPPADILVSAFENSGKSYIAILKLNYGECFTHKLLETENGTETQLVKNTAVLPLNASKVEEACLIPYDPMVLRIFEKPHVVNGEETEYFSQLFLECETEISKKEAAERIMQVMEEINEKHYGGNVEMEARLKCAMIEEAEETGEDDGLIWENVVRRAFPEPEKAEEITSEAASIAEDLGLPREVKLDKPFVQREFKMQRFKADNGVEIKCPAELFQDPDSVTLVNNPDGSVTITFKNLRRQESL